VSGIGGTKLRELTPDDIEDFLTEKISPSDGSRPLGHRSIVQIERVLRTALQWGKRNSRVRENVATDVVVPTEGGRRPSRTFTKEEVTKLLGAASAADEKAASRGRNRGGLPTRLEAAWSVMAGLGLRPGECFALKWENIDFEESLLYVRGSLVRDQGSNTLYVGPLKTPRSRRNLAVPPPVLDALRAHRKWQMSTGIASELVFTNDTGGPLDPSAVRRRFKKLCKAAGLADDRHPHELRHSVASYLSVVLGLPLERVADVLGHAGIATLLAVYRHVDVTPSVDGALGMADVFPIRPAVGE
jgi:integrase